jgi:general secretion pathway protein D
VRAAAGELDVGAVTIIADDKRNALIVKATTADYAKIDQVIRKLDTWPLQVLVEATIVDVELTDELSLGVEWFLKGKRNGRGVEARLDLGAPGIAPLAPGFSFAMLDSASNIRAVLNALAAESKLKVVSSPTMMVLDNHKASIRVGDQVPVRTSEAAGLGTSAASPVIASTFEYKETGVLLEVTPRVNASGMVHMEIHQEVNDVQATTSSGIDSPTINQRRINTTVAVQDGETVVLGGLIRDRKSGVESGFPGLAKIPLFGWLFKSRTDSAARSELIVVITPSAVRDQREARAVTEELQKRMTELTLPAWLEKKRQLPLR